jgi:hypothetical protein
LYRFGALVGAATVRTFPNGAAGMINFPNAWIKWGAALVVFGWGPLLLCIVGQAIGLVSRKANPVGLGLLFFVTAWPAIGCLLIGAFVWARSRARGRSDGDD